MISEESFAREEQRLGKQVHFNDGVWWVTAAPFYCKPVHEFRPFPPGNARPARVKALLGYSHQVPNPAQATRALRWNVLQGEDLTHFSLERIGGKKRNQVRMGLRECRVKSFETSDVLLEQMRQINISQAKRFESAGESGTFLPADHYDLHAERWREETAKLFGHQGHQLIGAFVGEALAAYVDLIRIEDTWMFGAVKSHGGYLRHRPVDALYFTILSMASQKETCNRVVNGGGDNERQSLTYFKGEFLLKSVTVPYFTQALLPFNKVRDLFGRPARRGTKKDGGRDGTKAVDNQQVSVLAKAVSLHYLDRGALPSSCP